MKLNIILVAVLFISISVLSAGTVQKSFSFESPIFVEKNGFDEVHIDELTFITPPGDPQLPSLPVHLLLPPGEKAVNVTISYERSEVLKERFNIVPTQKPYPISFSGKIEFEEPNDEVYSRNQFYPQNLTTGLTTQYMRGHAVAMFNLFPLQYNPQTKEIIFYRDLQVTIRTESSSEAQRAFDNFYRSDTATQNRLARLVSNSSEITRYPYRNNNRDVDDYEYIIITPNQFLTGLSDFAAFKQSQGYHVLIKTTEDIYSEYPGVDIADQVRNFIIDAYQNMGAEYVLLVGDVNLVPHRGFWVNAGGTEDFNIPSELYYEGLDRVGNGPGPDWNTNADNRWAETNEADYLTEVYVGRLSVENSTELSAALNKQIMYQNEPVIDDLETALMVGENLNNNPLTWGGTYKDEIISGGNFNGYSTVGIPANITVNTLYERDLYWGATNLANHMNSGLNILNHLGHSNTDYNMKFYNSTVTNQNITANGIDHNFFVIYSQGCLPAAIDTDCIAERFVHLDNGCAAYVGNTRYGWYSPGGTNSGSQYMDRQFFSALYSGAASKVSELNVKSKEIGVAQCNSSAWFRWSYYCLITLGDPTLDIWTATPTDIIASYLPSIPIGSNEITFQTDAPFARIGLIQNDELIGRVVADENGDAVLETFESILTPEDITVSIIAHDRNRYLGTLVVISNEPYVVFDSYQVNDVTGNNNGLPDYNESISLHFTLNNLGNQPTTDVTAVISTDDTYVTLTNDTAVFGDFGINQLITVDDAFSLNIDELIPDQHIVNFTLEVTGTSDETWTSSFQLVLNAPEFLAENVIVIDTNGNNNGILDPGETANFIIPTQNIGHADSPEALAALIIDHDLITVNDPAYNLGVINNQSSTNAIFSVTADPTLEIGAVIEMTFAVFAGVYYYEESFHHQVGLIAENFESGDFSAFPWEFSGSEDWQISDGAYEGAYCAKSGSIGHNAYTGIQLEIDVAMDGELSFWRTVSSEANYDFLRFYINGVLQDEWSGDVTWEQEIYNLSAGTHLLEWKYVKDQYVTGGTDNARIDYIVFPPLGIIFPPMININPTLINVEMMANDTWQEILEISNIGGEILNYSISNVNAADWLSFTPDNGNLATGETDEIILTFNSTGLTGGTYYSALMIDDGVEGQHLVPITLNITETNSGNNLIPLATELYGNHPNPFNPTTEISYGLNQDSKVVLNIYNIKGQKVRTLINEQQEAGYHKVHWNGLDEAEKQATSGVYFYEFYAEDTDYTSVKKMILLK